MSFQKDSETLVKELSKAGKLVKVGGIYSHFKHPEITYRVTGLVIAESTQDIQVLYQQNFGKKITFVRPLSSWLETPEWEGHPVPRFELIENP